MKHFSLFLAAMLMVLTLAGCGNAGNSTESENVDTTEKVNTEAESEEQNTEPAEAEGAEGTEKSETKILVAYFSATGTTKQIAEQIAEVTGADLFEIMPVDAYSSEDLDYGNDDCRANREQNDSTSRPEISNAIENIENYDTVFIGHPIWWGEEPRIIDTFLENYDFSGKTMIDFCTSGGSGICTSEGNLKELYSSDVNWLAANRFSSDTDVDTVRDWVQSLGIETKITNGGKDDGVF